MKSRPEGFLGPDKIDQDGEIFDYIRELHDYLWEFVRTTMPHASGDLAKYVDRALILSRDAAPLVNAARMFSDIQQRRHDAEIWEQRVIS